MYAEHTFARNKCETSRAIRMGSSEVHTRTVDRMGLSSTCEFRKGRHSILLRINSEVYNIFSILIKIRANFDKLYF